MKPNQKENQSVVTFLPEDTLEDKLRKAAHVRPSAAQLKWMEKEYIAFIHFGPNTFSGRQWGSGSEDPSKYTPYALDPAQWVELCAQAGMKHVIFTFKHHDGFCQWFTDATDFSISQSPVKKDIPELLQKACEANEIGLGVYLSPWDMYQRNQGLWNTQEYNHYFLKQLSELLTRYGRVDEVWFDGACGDYEIWKKVPTYNPDAWYDYIESVQPNAVFRMYDPYFYADEEKWAEIKDGKDELKWRGKAVRWVGNEEGKSRTDEWSVQPVFDRAVAENAIYPDLGQEKYYQDAAGAVWYPVEVNTTVCNQWFWNPDTTHVKSITELINIYYNSIGNNGVLLLNLSPDRNGLIPEDQAQRLMQLKTFIQRTFSNNLASKATAAAMEAPGHEAAFILDNNKMTYWTTDGEWEINHSKVSILFDLGQNQTFDNVLVQEFVREGQRIAEWSFEALIGDSWVELVHHKTIGYKNIKRFEPVTAAKVRLNILRSWDNPMISNFGLYLSDIPADDTDNAAEDDEEINAAEDTAENNVAEDIEEEASENSIIIQTIKQKGPEPLFADNISLEPGLKYTCYTGGIQSASLLEDASSANTSKTGIIPAFYLQAAESASGYSITYEGLIKIPIEGIYTFRLESADGSILLIGGKLCIDNDEPHDRKAVEKKMELKAGFYPIKVLYTSFRHNGYLKLYWSGPGLEMKEIDADCLYHNGK